MTRIAIIGTGLIGASLGMALRDAATPDSALGEVYITGYDADQRAANEARGRLAIDRVARSPEDAVQDAQVVVLATPVGAIQSLLAQLAPLLPEGAVVTDVASTKAEVCAWARDLLPDHVDFVGGHPMAGKEQCGAQAADPRLLRDAIYCLTPDPDTRPGALHLVEALVLAVGARPYYIDPHEHDAYVAGVSHLPFVLSAALMETVSRGPAWKEMAPLAASGFRDVSRLTSGDPTMHRDICLTNHTALIRWIDEMQTTLSEIRASLAQQDDEQLDQFFTHAHESRAAWLASTPGVRPGEEQFTAAPQVERGPLGFRKLFQRRRKP
jgi:prephenate dehydrogenase